MGIIFLVYSMMAVLSENTDTKDYTNVDELGTQPSDFTIKVSKFLECNGY